MFPKFSVSFLATGLLAIFIAASASPARAQSNSGTTAAPSSAPATTEKKHAKHVFTDDDFAPPPSAGSPAGSIHTGNTAASFLPRDPMSAKELASYKAYLDGQIGYHRIQTAASVSKLYLGADDVPFRGREDWNRRMMDCYNSITKALEDSRVQEEAVRREDAAILAMVPALLAPNDIVKLQQDRRRLLQSFEPVVAADDRFMTLKEEAAELATEWRKNAGKP